MHDAAMKRVSSCKMVMLRHICSIDREYCMIGSMNTSERLRVMKQHTENTVTIMDIPFLNTTKQEFLCDHLIPGIDRHDNTFVVTANPEIVMYARENARYKQVIQSADYVIPDGTGILMAAKYKKEPLQERIPGFELVLSLLEQAETNGFSCYLLGAPEAVNAKAVKEVQKKHADKKITGRHHGY